MNKEHILEQIRVLATANAGRPPGSQRFLTETGIRDHEWGRYWARWGDALIEAGFNPNEWVQELPDEDLLEKLAVFARELGRFPVVREMALRARQDPVFPSTAPFRRFGGQASLATRLREYSIAKGYDDVASFCKLFPSGTPKVPVASLPEQFATGFVYLFKSGRHYKIGRTNSLGRRQSELAIKIPVPPKAIHSIETDDAVGVEAYWHKRFADKRGEGEWFELSAEDVRAFKRWKRII